MPLLSDAKTCYVGTQPITKIFAGTQLVWGELPLRIVTFGVKGGVTGYLGAEFSERENCADCSALRSTYQYRWKVQNNWTAWQQFSGWTTQTTGGMAYINLNPRVDNVFDNGIFELRTNGQVEQITIVLAGLPDIGIINPELSC